MTTAADLMVAGVPRAGADGTAEEAWTLLRKTRWDQAGHVYLLDGQARLIGQVPVEALTVADPEARLATLIGDPPVIVHPEDEAEAVALQAVERHEADVAVVDGTGALLGAIPVGRLLALLHDEHLDDLLRMGGIGAGHPRPNQPDGLWGAFRARMPWLLLGLAGGWGAASIARHFGAALEREITLAFFLPLVVYMADAVGTQTETILVRSLAYGRISMQRQLAQEGLLGLTIGGVVGGLAGLGVLLFGGQPRVALVLTLTLAVTAFAATLVASLLPLLLDRFGADPALASGPIATVLQDLLSVAIYLRIATAVL
jgi:magnesium transporter